MLIKAGFNSETMKNTEETLYNQPTLSVLLFNHVCAKNNDGKLNENDVEPFFFVFSQFSLRFGFGFSLPLKESEKWMNEEIKLMEF